MRKSRLLPNEPEGSLFLKRTKYHRLASQQGNVSTTKKWQIKLPKLQHSYNESRLLKMLKEEDPAVGEPKYEWFLSKVKRKLQLLTAGGKQFQLNRIEQDLKQLNMFMEEENNADGDQWLIKLTERHS